ncbi:MAG: MFS transporter [Pseudomonadota bacterium]
MTRTLSVLREGGPIVVICLATTVAMMGHGIIGPVLPLFAREFGMSTASVGFVVATFGLCRLIMNLPSGLIAERYGTRFLMSAGLMLNALGMFLTGASTSILEMASWRFISGAGSAMFTTGSMSFIAANSTPENRGRLMSLQLGSLLIGTDIGPMIGGVIADHLGFRSPFYVAGIIAAVVALGVLIKLRDAPRGTEAKASMSPEDKKGRQEGRDIRTIRNLLANPTFFILSIFTLLVFFTRSGCRHTLLPLLAVEKVGMSMTQVGFLFTLMTTINLILAVLAGALTDRFGRKAVILPGAFLTLAGLTLFAYTSTVPAFFGAAFILGLGSGFIGPAPAAYAGDLAPPGRTGITMGLYRTFGDMGLISGPLLLGWIADVIDRQFAASPGRSVAMVLDGVLLLAAGLVLSWAGVETAGKKRLRKKEA